MINRNVLAFLSLTLSFETSSLGLRHCTPHLAHFHSAASLMVYAMIFQFLGYREVISITVLKKEYYELIFLYFPDL